MALLFEEESYRILGACFEVYKEKGCGFLEPVYQECLVIEFEIQNIPFEQQVELVLNYKGRTLVQRYKPVFRQDRCRDQVSFRFNRPASRTTS